jgi:uncharacterized membrane protein
MEDFEKELQKLQNADKKDLNEICKSLREKYFTIDSKTIYEKVSNICKTNSTSK